MPNHTALVLHLRSACPRQLPPSLCCGFLQRQSPADLCLLRSCAPQGRVLRRRFVCCAALPGQEHTHSGSGWKRKWHFLPTVTLVEQQSPPTALSWVRRRGPALPHVALEKLFRNRQVRLLVDLPISQALVEGRQQRLQRIARDTPLAAGMQLAIPSAVMAGLPDQKSAATDAASSKHGKALSAKLRASMLHMDMEVMVLNKPAGTPVQGGTDLPLSIDEVLAANFTSPDGHRPRLVHRLDMATLGAFAVARTPDAASWLAAAFARPAIGLAVDAIGKQQPLQAWPEGGPWVHKRYWAVVHTSRELPSAGSVDMPLPGSHRDGELVPAITKYSVRGRAPGLAWLECELITGRKHQIRLHCTHGLSSPVVGDQRHGFWGDAAAREQAHRLHGPSSRTWSKHLQLHCCQLMICKGGGHAAIHITAPPPEHMANLFAAHGWNAHIPTNN